TVRQAVDGWLRGGLPGRPERTRSVYREAAAPLLELIGSKPLRELTAGDVRAGLEALSGRLSTRYLQIAGIHGDTLPHPATAGSCFGSRRPPVRIRPSRPKRRSWACFDQLGGFQDPLTVI